MNKRTLADFSRQQLAQLGREYMLASQFNSRTGYAALRINHGEEAYKDTAIDNWMGASPVYTQRMQKAMGFGGGTDVATIFKGLQLECGLTHQYFDVHFEVFAKDKGRFWLKSCGPLLEAEQRGDEAVKVMCHDIEDPTFDATAIATNPRARMRPVHRPPRTPDAKASNQNHCEWNVFIDHEAEALSEPAITQMMRKTQLAALVIDRPASNRESGGFDYYTTDVFEQLQLEQLSHSALVVVCKEIAVQNHLLIYSMLFAIAERYGVAAAHAVAEFQMTGSAWVMSNRLCKFLAIDRDGIDKGVIDSVDAIGQVLAVHPAFQPCEYHSIEFTKVDANKALLAIKDSPASHEPDGFGWHTLLAMGRVGGLEALIKGVDPHAQLTAVEANQMVWEITISASDTLDDEPFAVQVAKGTVLYQTQLNNHIQLLQLND